MRPAVFILAFFISALVNMFQGVKTCAEERYGISDMAGRKVKCDEEGRLLATSDIVFDFSGLNKPEEDVSGNRIRDWIFCEAETAGDRDIYTPVKDRSFRLDITEDMSIRFLWVDRISGETRREESLPESFEIIYKAGDCSAPRAELVYEECSEGDRNYIRGKTPVLKISAEKELYTFLSVEKDGEREELEIEGESGEYVFSEGEYEFSVRSVDGGNAEYEAETDIDSFIYDNCPPDIVKLNVLPTGKDCFTDNGKVYSADPVMICPEAEDSLSGVDYYVFHVTNQNNKSEYEAYGDRLQLNPGFSGTVGVKAVDNAGNEAPEIKTREILIDNSGPVLKNRVFKENKKRKGEVLLSFDTADSLSGLSKLSLFLKGGLLGEAEFNGEKTGGIEYGITPKSLKDGKNLIKLEAEDITGNIAVFEYELNKEEKENRSGKDEPEYDEVPEMYLRGFDNFQKTEKEVTIEAGVSNDYPVEGRVSIEKHDMEGELTAVYEAEPGIIRVSDEGNYVIHYEIGDDDSIYEEYGYFTIDRSSPLIGSLKDVDKKTYYSFSILSDPLSSIEDYTYVDHRMTLSGREYDGREIKDPGKYILKISAVDELGHSSEETAEFLIVNGSGQDEDNAVNTVSADTLSSNKTERKKIVSGNTARKNHVKPRGAGREKIIYRNESKKNPVIPACGFFLCAAGAVLLSLRSVMERKGY